LRLPGVVFVNERKKYYSNSMCGDLWEAAASEVGLLSRGKCLVVDWVRSNVLAVVVFVWTVKILETVTRESSLSQLSVFFATRLDDSTGEIAVRRRKT
jgi:hypothetical protein